MKKTWVLIGGLAAALPLAAQFGITGGYRFNEATNWKLQNSISDDIKIFGDGYSIGLDYWFRLKNYRVEFLPELNFSQFSEAHQAGENDLRSTEVAAISFFMNTNFYLFDFKGDCDCPTFSKQGNLLKKGFFVQLSPGLTHFSQKVQLPATHFDSNARVLSLGLGAGFDIGLTDLLTLSPILGLRYYATSEWEELRNIGDANDFSGVFLKDTKSDVMQFFTGVRLGFRFDYDRPGSRRRR